MVSLGITRHTRRSARRPSRTRVARSIWRAARTFPASSGATTTYCTVNSWATAGTAVRAAAPRSNRKREAWRKGNGMSLQAYSTKRAASTVPRRQTGVVVGPYRRGTTRSINRRASSYAPRPPGAGMCPARPADRPVAPCLSSDGAGFLRRGDVYNEGDDARARTPQLVA
jgi:hypothetical protein